VSSHARSAPSEVILREGAGGAGGGQKIGNGGCRGGTNILIRDKVVCRD